MSMISVIIPTYNRAKTIRMSIESVLNQTYKDIEVIIIDDGSIDNTKEVINSILDERVHYIYQVNQGACAARNNGIRNAKGEYIAFHDSDDIWHKNKLQKQILILKNNIADIVVCKMNQYSENGEHHVTPKRIKEGIIKPTIDLFGIGTQTIVGKRDIINSVQFDENLLRYQDFEYLYCLSKYYTIYCVGEELVDYFINKDSISKNPDKMISAISYILDKHPEITKDYPIMALHMAKNLYVEGKYNNELKKNMDYRNSIRKCHINIAYFLKYIIALLKLRKSTNNV